jgi:2'-5' RNA ligase
VFFALWPGDAEREQLARCATDLELPSGARLVPARNYHVTVAFIGEVTAGELEALREVGASQRAAASALCLDRCEHWPEAQVVVAAARRAPPSLAALSARLHCEAALCVPRPAGARAPQPLRVHVTLARKVSQAPVRQEMSALEWSAPALTLVRSETGGQHSIYTVVDTWPLLYEAPRA